MHYPTLLLLALCLPTDPAPAAPGAIGGIVVRASDGQPVPGVDVVLRVKLEGEWIPVGETTADAGGEFLFRGLPLRADYVYLPGANHQGLHYSGAQVRLTPARPVEAVRLAVYDAVTDPSPLRALRHEVLIRHMPGGVEVTETLLIDNPSGHSYVGMAAERGGATGEESSPPVTLRLSIPREFERVTFAEEFYGRRFSIEDGRLETSIPWMPGRRELQLTYLLPNVRRHFRWERTLDLPCDEFEITVQTDSPHDVAGNLPGEPLRQAGQVVFTSSGGPLAAGEVLRIDVGGLPVSWMPFARWAALAALGASIVAAGAWTSWQKRRSGRRAGTPAAKIETPAAPPHPARSRRRKTKRTSRGSVRRQRLR